MMQELTPSGRPSVDAPTFYLTGREPLRPAAIVLALVGAVFAGGSVLFALGHGGAAHGGGGAGQGTSASASAGAADEKDDPNQVDTIVVGDPGDAPVPGRRGDHVSAVHPTILVHLPRFGEQVGLIPDSAAGHLLYGWLAALNHSDEMELREMLPNAAVVDATALQMELRAQSGGFRLLSAKEVQPGVMVFRLQDQTAAGGEVLGTLRVAEGASPAGIGSLSLRGIERAGKDAAVGDAAASAR